MAQAKHTPNPSHTRANTIFNIKILAREEVWRSADNGALCNLRLANTMIKKRGPSLHLDPIKSP